MFIHEVMEHMYDTWQAIFTVYFLLKCVTCFKLICAYFFTLNVTVSGKIGVTLFNLVGPGRLNKINIARLLEVFFTLLLLQGYNIYSNVKISKYFILYVHFDFTFEIPISVT